MLALSELTATKEDAVRPPCTPTVQYQQQQKHTQVHHSGPKQSTKSTQYSVNLTANGGLDMNLKKLKNPSFKLKKFAVGVTLAASTVTSGAP